MIKNFVCLANSRKLAGRCLAGIVDDGSKEWIRPISARPGGEVSLRESQYEDGSEPSVLDIVSTKFLHPLPSKFQSENWIFDSGYYWSKVGRMEWENLLTLEQHPNTLWINGYSTRDGNNNRVPLEQAETLTDSLKLIRVKDLLLEVHVPGEAFGNPRRAVNAHFTYARQNYILRVTDPQYEESYKARQNGLYRLGDSFLTISLGEPHSDDYTYKLVAAIIEREKI